MEKIQNIYDNTKFFKEYKKMRNNNLNANELLEIPHIIQMLPNIKGKNILDLGCGFGNMSRFFIENGANHVTAIDISKNMLCEARRMNFSPKIDYKILHMENITKLDKKYDIVFSSLAVHYVSDFKKLCEDINSLLNKNGYFVFSQEHPISTAIDHPKKQNLEYKHVDIFGKRYFLLSDYNNESKRCLNWNVDGVIKYHRSFTTIINNLIDSGFNVERIEESKPNDNATKLVAKYAYQIDKPYFLFLRVKNKK